VIFVKSLSCWYYCCINLQNQWFYCITLCFSVSTPPKLQPLLSREVPFQISCSKAKTKGGGTSHNKPHSWYCTSHTRLCMCIYIYIYLNMLQ